VPVDQRLADVRSIPELHAEPVSVDIAARAGSLLGPMHDDPAGRIIAATATVLGAALFTADDKLRSRPALRTIW
jgi:PIN domain nuclease of toxin-antitoxin system